MAIADRVIIMNNGQIVFDGSPDEAYRKAQSGWPASADATLLHDRMIADLRRRLDNRGG